MSPQHSSRSRKRLRLMKRSRVHSTRQKIKLDANNSIEGRNYDNYKMPYVGMPDFQNHDANKQRTKKNKSNQRIRDRNFKHNWKFST